MSLDVVTAERSSRAICGAFLAVFFYIKRPARSQFGKHFDLTNIAFLVKTFRGPAIRA